MHLLPHCALAYKLTLFVKYRHVFLFNALLICSLEDGYVVVYLGFLSLCDALRDPDDVATLLLLQFDVGVKYSEVELLQESKCVQLHLGEDKGRELRPLRETERRVHVQLRFRFTRESS